MRELRFEDIRFRVVRSDRKTVDLIVERCGSVLVRAPSTVQDHEIVEIIERKELWLRRALAEHRLLNDWRPIREYVPGEAFPYLGRCYRLDIVDTQDRTLVLRRGRFTLGRHAYEGAGSGGMRLRFQRFYEKRASIVLPDRVARYAAMFDIPVPLVRVRDLGFHWGSTAGRGTINIHWKVMTAPLKAIDYVVAHELTHSFVPDHSSIFWERLGRIMPDYVERRAWLRQNGATLTAQ